MIEGFLLGVALVGCFVAGAVDLKTTEVPDWIPYVMGIVGIVGNLVQSYLTGSYIPILMSVVVGLGYLGFGFLLYFFGQWGGGDAKILSSIGFLIPNLNVDKMYFPFSLGYLFNVFFVGAFYMIFYILVLSFINKKIWRSFFKAVKKTPRKLVLYTTLMILTCMAGLIYVTVYWLGIFNLYFSIKFGVFISGLIVAMMILWKFAKTVEDVGFKKKIPVSKLKVGDVLFESKLWEGITEKEVEKIKKSGKKHVWIKEGVRFTPSFLLSLVFTIYLGEGFVWILNLFG
jgi:Flp pilus assembly protein protease CpaA